MAAGLLAMVPPLPAALAATGGSSTQSLVLVPGVPIERPLAAGGVDTFRVELEAGKPWRLSVEQLGIDVVLEVEDPRRRSLLTVDGPLGREGTESLLLTPAVGGVYGVTVRSEKQGAPDGRFEIRLEELPAATPVDRLRLRAEAAMTDAGRAGGRAWQARSHRFPRGFRTWLPWPRGGRL